MVVGGAVAEIEAEERAKSHLAGHGERIRAKLEAATGNLNAQKAMIDDQAGMDESLKEKTDKVEADVRAVQTKLDEAEERRAALDRQREEIQQACQDKVEHLNSRYDGSLCVSVRACVSLPIPSPSLWSTSTRDLAGSL